MHAQHSSQVLDRLFDPIAQCLTPDVARELVNLRAQPDVQARIDELAVKCNEGALTPVEHAEYRDIVEAIDFISLLQAKARVRCRGLRTRDETRRPNWPYVREPATVANTAGSPSRAQPHVTFHVDHIVSRKHLGTDDPSNLALACERCNAAKGTDLTGVDPTPIKLSVCSIQAPKTGMITSNFVGP